MNCQEFRSRWGPHADEAILSHAAACDDCFRWVESLAGDEEVQYMKDTPQPSPHLEERIMQAIYQTAEHPTVPPLSAASHGQAQPAGYRPSILRRTYVWVGAASFLLAVGLWGLRSGAPEISLNHAASEIAASPTAEEPASAAQPFADQASGAGSAGQAGGHAPGVSPDTPVSAPATMSTSHSAADVTAVEEPTGGGISGYQGREIAPAEADTTTRSQAALTPHARTQTKTSQESSKMPPANSASAQTSPSKPAAPPETRSEPAGAAPDQTATARTVPEGNTSDGTVPEGSTPAGSAQTTQTESDRQDAAPAQPPANGTAQAEDMPEEAAVTAADPQLLNQSDAAKTAITVSIFTDANQAANASDLPVPVLSALPQGFALDSLTLQYESETSQKVLQITAVYRRGADWLTLDLYRNDGAERPLSVPGTFARRELFAIDGRQAIGVTYPPGSPGAPADHAVHANLSTEGRSFYAIAAAKGITLDQLIDVIKKLQWFKKS